MSKILGAWWWAFWSSTLIFLRDEGREMRHSQCFSPKKQCAFSLALPIHGNKKKSKKTKTKTTIKKNPHQKKKQTDPTHTKKEKKKRGKSHCHEFFPPLPFVAPSDEDMAPWQTVGEALLPQTLPKSARRGIKGFVCVYWWRGNVLSPIFHSVKDCSSLFVLQFCHQPNKRSTDKKCHMFFLGFISLS